MPDPQKSTRVEAQSHQIVEGLRLLLARLDSNELRAAEKYRHLVGILTFFVEHRISRPVDSDDVVRQTVDTIAAKLAQGEPILNLRAYSFGVAKNILNDYNKRPVHEAIEDHTCASLSRHWRPGLQESVEKELEEECRQQCLQKLTLEQREFLVRYYRQGLHCKDYRESLAREMSIRVEALSNRVSRIKKKLNGWRRTCLDRLKGQIVALPHNQGGSNNSVTS